MPLAGWRSKKTRSWPEGFRECRYCKILKSKENFTPFKKGAGGLYPYCKDCRKPASKKQWAQKSWEVKAFDRIKTRATKLGREFNLSLEDIPKVPSLCPVLKIPMKVPSIDRIDSSKGYIKGNIRVISNRANVLKNNATIEELTLVLQDLCEVVNIDG